jgi:hypothetical protein
MKFTSAYRVQDGAAQLQPVVAGSLSNPVEGKSMETFIKEWKSSAAGNSMVAQIRGLYEIPVCRLCLMGGMRRGKLNH